MNKVISKNKNTVVRVIFEDRFKAKYECVGVLIKENKDSIRIAFNAKNDRVVDFIDVKQSNIIKIDIIDPSCINQHF